MFPVSCAVCGRCGGVLCPGCARSVVAAERRHVPAELDELTILFSYEGAGRSLVHAYKYGGCLPLGRVMAAALASITFERVDLVVGVPTSKSRRLRRGFDQGQTLARWTASFLGVRHANLLVKVGAPQTGLPAGMRRTQVSLAANPRSAGRVRGRNVLLVDDVVTTGATLGAAAEVLKTLGARRVSAAVLASTPRAPRGAAGSARDGLSQRAQ